MFNTLISPTQLLEQLNSSWIIFDCRFNLIDKSIGYQQYRLAHLPNAIYVHLERDLSAPITRLTGRHPLPDAKQFVKQLSAWGVTQNRQVIVYDDNYAAFAGRLWWLLRSFGHQAVAVLDGGLTAWQRLAYPITTHLPKPIAAEFNGQMNRKTWINSLELENGLARRQFKLVDARTPERYRGDYEPIDLIAGHIPSAFNRPFQRNLNAQGLFLAPDKLANQFNQLLNQIPNQQVIHYCGSGVTACHNLLAMEYAGLSGSKLYVGSWSEWIANRNRKIVIEK